MAYMNQEKKALIAAALKKVVPAGWKYSLAVRNHSSIDMTVSSAPFDVIKSLKGNDYFNPETATHYSVNPYHYDNATDDESLAEVFDAIFSALNLDNHDNSDVQSDYFDVGHYVSLSFGSWNKPFVFTGSPARVPVICN